MAACGRGGQGSAQALQTARGWVLQSSVVAGCLMHWRKVRELQMYG